MTLCRSVSFFILYRFSIHCLPSWLNLVSLISMCKQSLHSESMVTIVRCILISNNPPLAHTACTAALLKGELLVPGGVRGFVGEDFDETRFNLFLFLILASLGVRLPLLAVFGYHFRVIKSNLNCSWNLSLKNLYKRQKLCSDWQYNWFIDKTTVTIN